MWAKYVEDQWRPWAEVDKRLKQVQHVYTELFSIYQRQQRLGEQYEVVLGTGLLVWRTPDGQNVQRHLIMAQTDIEFEAARGLIRVGPAGEGARPVLEQDMLDARHRPEPNALRALETEASEIGDDIWNRTKLHSVLAGWVHAASPRGAYNEGLARAEGPGHDPWVHLAPAIVLRRRTERGYVRAFEEIIHQLDEGVEVPPALKHFVVSADQRGVDTNADETGPTGGTSEIYFPLEANEAQREIVERLQTHQGVLVQGPPGTGKSHTIVNLICHLLASGKRILVTSHTARALTVLKRFLSERTPEVAPLAVVVLGDDRESLEAMEISVQGIMDRHNQWNAAANEHRVAEAGRALRQARERHADTLNNLRSLRERETYEHPPRFESYQGTLQRIGEQLRGERERYGWIEDRPSEDAEPPLSDDEAQTLLCLLRDKALDEALSWGWKPIDPSMLPAPDHFQALVDQERAARRHYDDTDAARRHPAYGGLLDAPADVRGQLSEAFAILLKEVDEITQQFHKWAGSMVAQILGDFDRPWRELFEVTQTILSGIGDRARWADETNISGLEGKEFTRIKADAEDLLRHFQAKGGWGMRGFRPRVVKRALYLREEVRIGGRPCETKETLQDLVSWLDVTLRLQHMDRLWQAIANVVSATFAARVKEYEDLCEPLERGLGLHEKKSDLQNVLKGLAAIPGPTWHDLETVRGFYGALQAAEAEIAVRAIGSRLDEAAGRLDAMIRSGHTDPSLRDLVGSLRARDVDRYSCAWMRIKGDFDLYQKILQKDALQERLKSAASKLAEDLVRSAEDPKWDRRLAEFRRAWNWARARAWIDRLSDPKEDRRLRLAFDAQRRRIRETLEVIAAAKAWGHCFGRMTEYQRGHLIAWSQATKRIGKNTGKYAPLHRKAAREHMQECRGAIPAWIMPLYRVVETIQPGKDRFDVAIIDEASQSGPEAVLLTYLADKIVVVGDDKQISPQFVGINREDVNQLRLRHIYRDCLITTAMALTAASFTSQTLCIPAAFRCVSTSAACPKLSSFRMVYVTNLRP